MNAPTGQRGAGAEPARDAAAPRSRWWRREPWAAPRIAGLYALLGFSWIAFSDRMVAVLSRDPAIQERIQTVKGTLFVAVTAAVLYALIRRSERRLRALGAEVRTTVDSMPDGVLLVDGRRNVVEANRAALALLAAPKAEILGPLAGWAHRFQVRSSEGTPVPADRSPIARALAGDGVGRDGAGQHELVLRRGDGRDAFVSMAVSRVERPGEPPLAVAVLRDVSAARRLDETREEFLSTAAHELKTPLAVIRAYAQLLARREPADRRALDAIQRQVDRLSRLVQQLLDTSRLRLDSGPGRPEPVDLAALARDVMDRIRPSAPDHELEVRADGPVNVVAERERLGRVLTCLVDNAVRFSPGGGHVRLVVSCAGEEALVSVEDEGVGIPLDRQGQIFERYYRAHAGTPQDYGGLGLGLGMSREIVERHGGRMWFESSPGAGSKFHFGLPLRREDA